MHSVTDWDMINGRCCTRNIWKNMRECRDGSFFPGGKITLKQLERYVRDNSSGLMETQMLTRHMEREIVESQSEDDFFAFMNRNVQNFSSVREKARYYFCKYLYLYIRQKCEHYFTSAAKNRNKCWRNMGTPWKKKSKDIWRSLLWKN